MGTDDWHRLVRYYNTEPFGFPRAEARFAELTAAVYRSSPNSWKNKSVLNPKSWKYKQPKSIDIDEITSAWGSMAGLRTKRRGD